MTKTTEGGRMLARLRTEAGLSQNQLARLASIDPAYVNRIERNALRVHPSREVVLRLRDGLGIDLAEGDRLLYAFGLAPSVDWQGVWDAALTSAPGELTWRREP